MEDSGTIPSVHGFQGGMEGMQPQAQFPVAWRACSPNPPVFLSRGGLGGRGVRGLRCSGPPLCAWG